MVFDAFSHSRSGDGMWGLSVIFPPLCRISRPNMPLSQSSFSLFKFSISATVSLQLVSLKRSSLGHPPHCIHLLGQRAGPAFSLITPRNSVYDISYVPRIYPQTLIVLSRLRRAAHSRPRLLSFSFHFHDHR